MRTFRLLKKLLFACLIVPHFVISSGCNNPGNRGTEPGTGDVNPGANGGSNTVTYDLQNLGVPKFATYNYIDLTRIAKVTPYRGTGWGHDYNDGTETCRTLKHYFFPSGAGSTWNTVPEFAPVSGTISKLDPEQTGGTQLHLKSDIYPAITFIIFHSGITGHVVGDHLTAGDSIGTHALTTTTSDIAVMVQTPEGGRLVSYFDTLTDPVFAEYQARGVSTRSQFVITKSDRDSDSTANNITCDAQGYYSNAGSLPAWVILN